MQPSHEDMLEDARQKTRMYLVCWIRTSTSHQRINGPPHQVTLQSCKGPRCITKTTMDLRQILMGRRPWHFSLET